MSGYFSQAQNFTNTVQGGVDPRTGAFSFSLSIGKINGNNGIGPEFDIGLNYSSINPNNIGLGVGVGLSLSLYDIQNKLLILSTGENYKIVDTPIKFEVLQKKLDSFRFERFDDYYKITYKTGVVEFLDGPKTIHKIKNVTKIISPLRRTLTLQWVFKGGMQLSSIKDESETLLNIDYSNIYTPTIFLYPNHKEQKTFILKLANQQLKRFIHSESNYSWQFEHDFVAAGYNLLKTIIHPTGLKETIAYERDTLRFPKDALPALPAAVKHTLTPGFNQPELTKLYSYTNSNYLGFGSGIDFKSDTDNLYGVLNDYTYGSTEQQKDGDTIVTIDRTYNSFHLLIEEIEKRKVSGFLKTRVKNKYVYYAKKGLSFDNQLPQFQFPKVTTSTFTDLTAPSAEQSRTEVTYTEFDVFGNTIKEQGPDGSITEYTYYSADGEGSDCPPDPYGFTRFIKTQVVKARNSEYADTPELSTLYTYGTLGNTDVVVQTSATEFMDVTPLVKVSDVYNSIQSDPEFGRLTSQVREVFTQNSEQTFKIRKEFNTSVSDGKITHKTSILTHDGLEQTTEKTYSCHTNNLLSEVNSEGVETQYEYEKTGRILKKIWAIGSDYENETYYEYSIEPEGLVALTKDSLNNKVKTYFDGLGREISKSHFDADHTNKWYTISSQAYNALGVKISGASTDWDLRSNNTSAGMEVLTNVDYDRWGFPNQTTLSYGVSELDDNDPVSLIQNRYLKSADNQLSGKHITVLNQDNFLPRIKEQRDADNALHSSREYQYDGLGKTRRVINNLGEYCEYTYDAFGRLLTYTLTDGTTVTKEYAPHSSEELVSKISITGMASDGERRTWVIGEREFDGLGRLTQEIVGGRVTSYSYEGSASMPSQTLTPSNGRIIRSYIPELGNVIKNVSVFTDGISDPPVIQQTFDYDPATGNLLRIREGETYQENEWNASGELIKERIKLHNEELKTASYEYTILGNAASYTDITGSKTQYKYDERGRLIHIIDNALQVIYDYDAFSRVKSKQVTNTRSNATLSAYLEHDDFNRETKRTIVDSEGGTLTIEQIWSGKNLLIGRKTRLNENIAKNERYTYDVRNRLVNYSVTGDHPPADAYGHLMLAQRYQYDALDNLFRVETDLLDGSSDIAVFCYENEDDPMQLTKVTHSDAKYPAEITLLYDNDGRMIQDDAGRRLTYDVLGRLVMCDNGQYYYDGLNRLVTQVLPDASYRNNYYRDNEIVNHTVSSENIITRIIKSAHTCFGVQNDNEVILTEADQNNSLLWSHSNEKSSGESHVWSPYGSGKSSTLLPGFNGEYSDMISGSYHLGNGFRAYNPVLMRFNCPDNLSPFEEGGINPYAYCAGDPINFTDPTGHARGSAIAGIVLGFIGVVLTTLSMGSSGIAIAAGITATLLGVGSITTSESNSGLSAALGWMSLITGFASIGGSMHKGASKAVQRLGNRGIHNLELSTMEHQPGMTRSGTISRRVSQSSGNPGQAGALAEQSFNDIPNEMLQSTVSRLPNEDFNALDRASGSHAKKIMNIERQKVEGILNTEISKVPANRYAKWKNAMAGNNVSERNMAQVKSLRQYIAANGTDHLTDKAAYKLVINSGLLEEAGNVSILSAEPGIGMFARYSDLFSEKAFENFGKLLKSGGSIV